MRQATAPLAPRSRASRFAAPVAPSRKARHFSGVWIVRGRATLWRTRVPTHSRLPPADREAQLPAAGASPQLVAHQAPVLVHGQRFLISSPRCCGLRRVVRQAGRAEVPPDRRRTAAELVSNAQSAPSFRLVLLAEPLDVYVELRLTARPRGDVVRVSSPSDCLSRETELDRGGAYRKALIVCRGDRDVFGTAARTAHRTPRGPFAVACSIRFEWFQTKRARARMP